MFGNEEGNAARIDLQAVASRHLREHFRRGTSAQEEFNELLEVLFESSRRDDLEQATRLRLCAAVD